MASPTGGATRGGGLLSGPRNEVKQAPKAAGVLGSVPKPRPRIAGLEQGSVRRRAAPIPFALGASRRRTPPNRGTHMATDVILVFESLHCTRESDGTGHSEPY